MPRANSAGFLVPGTGKRKTASRTPIPLHVPPAAAAKFFSPENGSGSGLTRGLLLFLLQIGVDTMVDILEFRRRIADRSFYPGLIDPEYTSWQINQTLRQMQKYEYVRMQESPSGKITVRLTKKGVTRALTYNLDSMVIVKPKRWDRLWRVVIFDIPNRYGRIRQVFRKRLVQLGLRKLQESVYASPYPCFDEVEFLREVYGVAFTVRYLLVQSIEDDGELRSWFQLQDA